MPFLITGMIGSMLHKEIFSF